MSAPAGWYAQPDGSQRYWDGAGWTSATAPGSTPQDRPADATGQVYPYAAQPSPYAAPTNPYAAQPGYAVAPKNPGLALLASFFLPGLGSMINGEVGKGVAILLLYLVSWPLILVLIGIPMMFGIWIWGMVDAYTGAQNWNRRHGIWS